MKAALSVIITWCDRPELLCTLAENRRVLDTYELEVIVVNCGGSDQDLRKILSGAKPRTVRWLNVQTTVFNKALAVNLGASVARSDCLFLLDTDIILTEDFLPTAFDCVAEGHFFTVARVLESTPDPALTDDYLEEMTHRISFVAKGDRKATATVRRRFQDGTRNAPGLAVLARKYFLEVGGMNADLRGYGFEDRDLLLRLQFALSLEERSAGTALHISHNNEDQYAGWRNRRQDEHLNFAACLKNYRSGHYAGTYYDDIAVWKERLSLADL